MSRFLIYLFLYGAAPKALSAERRNASRTYTRSLDFARDVDTKAQREQAGKMNRDISSARIFEWSSKITLSRERVFIPHAPRPDRVHLQLRWRITITLP